MLHKIIHIRSKDKMFSAYFQHNWNIPLVILSKLWFPHILLILNSHFEIFSTKEAPAPLNLSWSTVQRLISPCWAQSGRRWWHSHGRDSPSSCDPPPPVSPHLASGHLGCHEVLLPACPWVRVDTHQEGWASLRVVAWAYLSRVGHGTLAIAYMCACCMCVCVLFERKVGVRCKCL